MKKLLLITIILLLQSFPSFGSPIGKGLICKCRVGKVDCPSEYTKWWSTFYFRKDNVKNNVYYYEKDKIKILSIDLKYRLSPKFIKIYIDIKNPNYILNRETLILSNKYECGVFDKEETKKREGYVIDLLQKDYDKKKSKNKI